MSDDEIKVLWGAIREILQESVDLGGSTWEMDLHGRKGRWDESFFHLAHREGQPCPVCGTEVEKIKTGAPAALSVRAASRLSEWCTAPADVSTGRSGETWGGSSVLRHGLLR